MRAIWNGTVVAESDETVVVEGNHYFPRASIRSEFFSESGTTSFCPWKGTANYFSLEVSGERNEDAVWTYAEPKEETKEIAGHVAFWKGVEVTD